MKVNVICSDFGWIYEQFIEAFKKYSRHEIVVNATADFDVVHYLPYFEQQSKSAFHPSTAWFSHQEQKEPLRTKFLTVAKQVDFCFSHSQKYANLLIRMGTSEHRVKQIVPGIDLEAFKPDTDTYKRHEVLKVGYVGRPYKSSIRKNPVLLEKIATLKGIEVHITGGSMKAEHLPDFYRSMDLIVSPSSVEGGPMCIIESLACGKPVFCFGGV
jgi:glycosyltransferase involved in cell wall biosynthesis